MWTIHWRATLVRAQCDMPQVREFEPSETAYTEDEDEVWGQKKGCCIVM